MFITLSVAVRYINCTVSAKNTETWRKHVAESSEFPQVNLWYFVFFEQDYCKHYCALSHKWRGCCPHSVIYPTICYPIVQWMSNLFWDCKKKRKRGFTRLYTSTLTINLNLLLHYDSGKGYAERDWALGFRIRARLTMSNIVQTRGNGLYLSAGLALQCTDTRWGTIIILLTLNTSKNHTQLSALYTNTCINKLMLYNNLFSYILSHILLH